MSELELLPPAQDLKALIREEHQRAELQRLDMGIEGCGCTDCQELYKELDLSKYGSRVKKYGEFIIIEAKQAKRLNSKVDTVSKLSTSPLDSDGDVSKIKDEGNITENFETSILKQRGRPKKTGNDVSRATAWRRRKEVEAQGVLV